MIFISGLIIHYALFKLIMNLIVIIATLHKEKNCLKAITWSMYASSS